MQIRYSNIGIEPVTLIEAKAWMKIDYTHDDSLISSLITSIREIAEEISGLALVPKTVEYFEDNLDILKDWIVLPCPAHDTIIEVKINGQAATYSKSGLNQFMIRGNSTISTDVDEAGLYVKYTTLGTCSGGMKHAILKEITECYEKRGSTTEVSSQNITSGFFNYLQQFKVY
jgi:hypothetical protein